MVVNNNKCHVIFSFPEEDTAIQWKSQELIVRK